MSHLFEVFHDFIISKLKLTGQLLRQLRIFPIKLKQAGFHLDLRQVLSNANVQRSLNLLNMF